jgi:hypothetical protein
MGNKNTWDDKFVKCPYYHKSESNKIVCDGLMTRTSLHIVFVNTEDKKNYLRSLCCSIRGYHDCPINKILEESYQDE